MKGATVEEADAFDEKVLVAGYRAGTKNEADFSQRDKAYWHGYLNGQVDGGFMQISGEQQQFASDFVRQTQSKAAGLNK